MNTTKKALCVLISGATLGLATPAFADRGHDRGWDRGRGQAYGHQDRGRHYGHRHYAPRVVVVPAPAYYPPRAYSYYQAPVYSAPVYVAPPVAYYGVNPGVVVGAVIGGILGSQF